MPRLCWKSPNRVTPAKTASRRNSRLQRPHTNSRARAIEQTWLSYVFPSMPRSLREIACIMKVASSKVTCIMQVLPMTEGPIMATDLTHSLTVDQTPQQVFDAINDVRQRWCDSVVGDTASLGAEWVYLTPDIHFSKQRTTVLVPGERVEWLVVDSHLSFTEEKQEWTGTTIRFEIMQPDGPEGRTRLVFTHVGLTNEAECHDVCETAWGQYVV